VLLVPDATAPPDLLPALAEQTDNEKGNILVLRLVNGHKFLNSRRLMS